MGKSNQPEPRVVLVQPDTFVGYSLPFERTYCLGGDRCPNPTLSECESCRKCQGVYERTYSYAQETGRYYEVKEEFLAFSDQIERPIIVPP